MREKQEQVYRELLDCKNIDDPEVKSRALLDIIKSYVEDRSTVINYAISIKAN